MPLYEYRCRKCGKQFERIRKFSDSHLTKCEKCGGKLELLLSSAAVQFKGTGWYVTDYPRRPAVTEKEKPAVESKGDKSSAEKTSGGAAKPAESAGKRAGPKTDSKT